MSKKIIHTNYPWPKEGLEGLERVADFLPKPEDLVFHVKTKPVTLPISEKTFALYQRHAKNNHIDVELMLAAILNAYADQLSTK